MSIRAKALPVFPFFTVLLTAMLFVSPTPVSADSPEPGLLFHLSGDYGLTADYASGAPEPNIVSDVTVKSGGPHGPWFECENKQLMAYWAPGNVYAQRGTVSFFWRSRIPAGKTPFPIFRVSYSDHSSWDAAWLRIDWNGTGFEAFVTEINLARLRCKHALDAPLDPERWVHIALSWDELEGVRLYLDGERVAQHDTTAVFYAGLDQFGPHSRIISSYQVQSLYNFQRGGDIDEIKFYDHMLADNEIARLSNGQPAGAGPFTRSLDDPEYNAEWLHRYGWNRPNDIPPYLADAVTTVRKVETTDVYDVKQWFWKGADGIRETTWPGVYNMSRIPGRWDYFTYPDWNCYSISGKKVTFFMPDEPWNHIEIAGAAYGTASHTGFDLRTHSEERTSLFYRPQGQERTYHRLDAPINGGGLTFENIEQEAPIGELYAYHVSGAPEPEGTVTLSYSLTAGIEPDNPCLEELTTYIDGRFMTDERTVMLAHPRGAPGTKRTVSQQPGLPIMHILVPFEFRQTQNWQIYSRYNYGWENLNGGLDGVAIDIPALDVAPTHGDYFPLNIQVKDPVWPERNLLDFTFSVKPGEPRTLWLDTRDRILPNGRSLYITIAGASADFGADDLEGAKLRLVFKDREASRAEHELDRFTQVKDNWGHLVEEHANIKTLKMYDRLNRDMTDLLRINPDHHPGRLYWCNHNPEQGWPAFEQPKAPADVPLWAFRQVEDMKLIKQWSDWWIDNRMIENGELGGGLSDDGDHTCEWPGLTLMGITPDKFKHAISRLMDEYYNQGLFTNGLPTIQADELHSYEEGISVQPQVMLTDYADPKIVERIMETVAGVESVTGINEAGHRHFRSTFYGGNAIADESIWLWSKPYSYLNMHPAMILVEYNGHPAAKKFCLEMADGLLAHRKKNPDGTYTMTAAINFETDEDRPEGLGSAIHLLWAAWRWTGDKKYLAPLTDMIDRGDMSLVDGSWGRGFAANIIDMFDKRDTWGAQIASSVTPRTGNDTTRHFAWLVTGNKQYLEEYYADQIQRKSQHMYIYTEGHPWSDRARMNGDDLQRSRLGGIALARNLIYPGHVVSWDFEAPSTAESVAILVRHSTPSQITIVAFNLEDQPVTADMTAWDITPGKWQIEQGIDTNDDDVIDGKSTKDTVVLERTKSVQFTFPAKKTTVLNLRRKSSGKDYWSRPDLGIGDDDITVSGRSVSVTVHSLGSVGSPNASVALVDANGEEIAAADIPELEAPLDFLPKTAMVTLAIPSNTDLEGCTVVIDPDEKITEITRLNNIVPINRD